MALGELAKQIAGQAIGNPAKEVMDALRPGEAAPARKPGVAEAIGATMVGQLQAMQRALKEDQELVVMVQACGETLRLVECFLPSWEVAVITGIDRERNVARVISPVESLQFVCRPAKAQQPGKPLRIAFVVPKG